MLRKSGNSSSSVQQIPDQHIPEHPADNWLDAADLFDSIASRIRGHFLEYYWNPAVNHFTVYGTDTETQLLTNKIASV